MRPIADCSRHPPLGRIRNATRSRTTSATSDSTPTTHRQPAGIPESSPNASPVFMTSVNAKKPSTSTTGTPRVRRWSTISLAIWSRTTTTAAIATTRPRRDRSARIAGTTQPRDDGDAALAEGGMLAALADVHAARPAALPLLARRAVDTDHQAGDVLALVGDTRPRGRAIELDARHDERRRQELALGGEQCREILGRIDDPHRGLEPAADELRGPRGLERLGDLAADLQQAIPVALERVVEPF